MEEIDRTKFTEGGERGRNSAGDEVGVEIEFT